MRNPQAAISTALGPLLAAEFLRRGPAFAATGKRALFHAALRDYGGGGGLGDRSDR